MTRSPSDMMMHTMYCGRSLGSGEIPGSDGQCGPTNGPQCADCQAGPVLMSALQKSVQPKAIIDPKVLAKHGKMLQSLKVRLPSLAVVHLGSIISAGQFDSMRASYNERKEITVELNFLNSEYREAITSELVSQFKLMEYVFTASQATTKDTAAALQIFFSSLKSHCHSLKVMHLGSVISATQYRALFKMYEAEKRVDLSAASSFSPGIVDEVASVFPLVEQLFSPSSTTDFVWSSKKKARDLVQYVITLFSIRIQLNLIVL